MKELNPRDNSKLLKIYENMLKKNFEKKKIVKEEKKQKIRDKSSPWDQIKEDKYL